jgi:hypothetical protein
MHSCPSEPHIAIATELIVIKYKESNITNLKFFNLEGLNKISLEHIFIKNNSDLYGRYQNSFSISDIDEGAYISHAYKKDNNFFQRIT